MKFADKQNCTGCGACYSICPTRCILMIPDTEGFLYPTVDGKNCTGCTKCEEICPSIVQGIMRKPLKVYAAKNLDEEIRYQSSSGGIFTLLAEYVIKEDGVVFGALFNDAWEVVHDYTEAEEGLAAFRGSKYVQSIIGDTFVRTKEFLQNGRKVLYSGTPCQIAGLKGFLRKEYDNLLTIDFVCHGVPSPLVWRKYLTEISAFMNVYKICNIKFRSKKHGWRCDHLYYEYILSNNEKMLCSFTGDKNEYYRGFIQGLFTRLSCHSCPVRSLKSGSDITIADYWGIQNVLPEFDDGKGISLVMVVTEKGKNIYNLLNVACEETSYNEALVCNRNIDISAPPHLKRAFFFKHWNNVPVISLIAKLTLDPLQVRLRRRIVILLQQLGLLVFIKSLLNGDPK